MTAQILPFTPITAYTIQFANETPQPIAKLSPVAIRQARIAAEVMLGDLLPVNPVTKFPDFVIYDSNEEMVEWGGMLIVTQ